MYDLICYLQIVMANEFTMDRVTLRILDEQHDALSIDLDVVTLGYYQDCS